MSAYTGYKIDNQSVSEVHRSEEKGDTAQLSVPFSQRFLKHMKIEILSRCLCDHLFIIYSTFQSLFGCCSLHFSFSTDEELTFDLTGVDASVANALRRIMLAEVRGGRRS